MCNEIILVIISMIHVDINNLEGDITCRTKKIVNL